MLRTGACCWGSRGRAARGAGGAAVTLEPIGSFTNPVFITSEPDDPDQLLVVERRGVSGGETAW